MEQVSIEATFIKMYEGIQNQGYDAYNKIIDQYLNGEIGVGDNWFEGDLMRSIMSDLLTTEQKDSLLKRIIKE